MIQHSPLLAQRTCSEGARFGGLSSFGNSSWPYRVGSGGVRRQRGGNASTRRGKCDGRPAQIHSLPSQRDTYPRSCQGSFLSRRGGLRRVQLGTWWALSCPRTPKTTRTRSNSWTHLGEPKTSFSRRATISALLGCRKRPPSLPSLLLPVAPPRGMRTLAPNPPALPTQQAFPMPSPNRPRLGHSFTPPLGSPKSKSCRMERVRFLPGPPVGGSRTGRAQCRLCSITHPTQTAQGPRRVEMPVFAQLPAPPHLKQRRSCLAANASSACL